MKTLTVLELLFSAICNGIYSLSFHSTFHNSLYNAIPSIRAVIFRDMHRGLYLSRLHEDILMSPYPEEALDLSLQDTDPKSISSILSLGTKALTVERNSLKIDIGEIDFNDKREFFRIILNPEGTFVFQHNDLCVGYSSNFTHRLIDATNRSPYLFLEMVECTDIQNIIYFLKSEKINGEAKAEIKRTEIITAMDRDLMTKSAKVTKTEEQVLRPEETGFLKGIVGRVTHLF